MASESDGEKEVISSPCPCIRKSDSSFETLKIQKKRKRKNRHIDTTIKPSLTKNLSPSKKISKPSKKFGSGRSTTKPKRRSNRIATQSHKSTSHTGSQIRVSNSSDSEEKTLSPPRPTKKQVASSKPKSSSKQTKGTRSPTTQTDVWFSSSECEELYNNRFMKKKDMRGRTIIFSSILHSFAVGWVSQMGWSPIMALDVPFFPQLVKLFFSNMKYFKSSDGDTAITSTILGTDIVLTDTCINKIFGLSDSGIKFFGWKDICPLDVYKDSEAKSMFWGGHEVSLAGGDAVKSLSAEHTIIYKFITTTILPIGGHSTDINRMTLFLMFMAVKGIHVNLGYIILHYIILCFDSIDKQLPFGMFFSHLLYKQGINPPSEWKEPESSRLILDKSNLAHMRIHQKKNCEWFIGTKIELLSAERNKIPKPSGVTTEQSSETTKFESSQIIQELQKLTSIVQDLQNKLTSVENKVDLILEMP